MIDPDPAAPDARLAAVARAGPDAGCGDAEPVYLHTLTAGRLAWLAARTDGTDHAGDLRPAAPRRGRRRARAVAVAALAARRATCSSRATPSTRSATATSAQSGSAGLPWWEYDGDDGDSVRFGTGAFGERPPAGATFDVTYRVTAGCGRQRRGRLDHHRAVRPHRRRPVGHQPVRRHRRRGRGDHRPRPAPARRTPSARGSSGPSGPRTTTTRRRGAAVGARRRHRDALDRQLAHRLHHRPADRTRAGDVATSTSR